MARRRTDEDDGVSLFPFLSVIACVIGVLTLLISALALSQMSGDDVATLEAYEAIQRESQQLQKEIDELKGQADADALRAAAAMNQRQRELAAARQRLDRLLKQIIELRRLLAQLEQEVRNAENDDANPRQPVEALRDELAGLKKKIEELQAELKGQTEQLAQLEKDLDERKKPPVPSEVTVLPSGSGSGLEPVFVECSGGAAIVHGAQPAERIKASELAQNETFVKLLADVAASNEKRLVFLVRDNGLGTYRAARRLAGEHEAVYGALPVVGEGRLDLSRFSQPE